MPLIEALMILLLGVGAGVGMVLIFDKERVVRSGKRFVEAADELQKLMRERSRLQKQVKDIQVEIRDLEQSVVQHVHELSVMEVIYAGEQDTLQSSQRVNASEAIMYGRGREWVYLYTFPTHEHLANERRETRYPMKLGMSTQADVMTRIHQQVSGNSTALSERVIVKLVFRVNCSREMESWMHAELKRMGRKVADSIGIEWYKTNPSEVEQLFRSFVLKYQRNGVPIVEV